MFIGVILAAALIVLVIAILILALNLYRIQCFYETMKTIINNRGAVDVNKSWDKFSKSHFWNFNYRSMVVYENE